MRLFSFGALFIQEKQQNYSDGPANHQILVPNLMKTIILFGVMLALLAAISSWAWMNRRVGKSNQPTKEPNSHPRADAPEKYPSSDICARPDWMI